jgi:DNA invertase Pin-like site-specific DNA recombinase
MNVLGYIRVSGDAQVEKDGPVRQLNSIQAFCLRHSLSFAGHFFEAAVSGTKKGIDRPAWAEMLAAIDSRKSKSPELHIGAVVLERIDRLARDFMVQEVLIRELRDRDVRVFLADVGTLDDYASNDGDPTKKMIRQLLGIVAEWERAVICYKMRAAKDRIRNAHGRCEGYAPYGIEPSERKVVDRIANAIQSGRSFRWVAQSLNDSGIPTRRDMRWSSGQVYRVYKSNLTATAA